MLATASVAGIPALPLTDLLTVTAGIDPAFVQLLSNLAQEHRRLLLRETTRLRQENEAIASELKRSNLLLSVQGSPKHGARPDRSSLHTNSTVKSNTTPHSGELSEGGLEGRSLSQTSLSAGKGSVADGDIVVFGANDTSKTDAVNRISVRHSAVRRSSANTTLPGKPAGGVALKAVWNIPVSEKIHFCSEWYRNAPVIAPYSRFVHMWRWLTMLCTIAAVTMAPFDIAFYWWVEPSSYSVASVVLDIIFLCDMVFNFNTAFVDHGNTIVTDRYSIAMHYLKTWFVLDVVSNAPVDWFVGSEGKSRKFVKFLKLPKILRFIKLLRVLKESLHYIGVTSCFAMILMLAHVFTCLWALVLLSDCETRGSCPNTGATYIEGLSMCLGILLGDTSSVDRLRNSDTLGVMRGGDPLHSKEELMAMAMSIIGLVLISCFFATTASAIKAKSVVARTRARMLSLRRLEMKKAKIPKALRRKVEETYEHQWERAKGDHDGMLRDPLLSLDLRRNLALHIYGAALRKVPLLQDVHDRCLKCLAQRVEVRTYTPGDMLMLFGEIGTELFILQQGLVQPVRESGEPLRDCYLGEGSVIGEICFLQPGLRRTASILCVEFCVALVLTVDMFVELRLTDLLEALRAQAAAMQKDYVDAPKASSSPPSPGASPAASAPQSPTGCRVAAAFEDTVPNNTICRYVEDAFSMVDDDDDTGFSQPQPTPPPPKPKETS